MKKMWLMRLAAFALVGMVSVSSQAQAGVFSRLLGTEGRGAVRNATYAYPTNSYVQTGYVPTAPLQVPPVMVAQVPQEGIDFNRQVINPGQALPTTGRPFFNPFELDANIIDLRRNPGFSNTFLKQGAVAFAPTAPAAPAKSMPVPPSKSWPGS